MSNRERKEGIWSASKILEFCAYIGTGLIAIALLLSVIFGSGSLSQAFSNVGQAIAYIVTMIIAGLWVRRKRHVAWLVCYIVFVVAIVVLYILGIVL